jgi:hypothetical protein
MQSAAKACPTKDEAYAVEQVTTLPKRHPYPATHAYSIFFANGLQRPLLAIDINRRKMGRDPLGVSQRALGRLDLLGVRLPRRCRCRYKTRGPRPCTLGSRFDRPSQLRTLFKKPEALPRRGERLTADRRLSRI